MLKSLDSIAVERPVTISGAGELWAGKSLRAVVGSNFQNGRVTMSDSTGTAYINGTFAPDTTLIDGALYPARLRSLLGYKKLLLYTANAQLDGDISVTRLYVYSQCCQPYPNGGRGVNLNGHRLTVSDSLHTDYFGSIVMKNTADLLIVGGNAWFNGYTPDTSITAGEIRVAGNVLAQYGDRHLNLRGTNLLTLNGTVAQSVSMDDYANNIQNLQIANNGGGVTITSNNARIDNVGSRPRILGNAELVGKWNNPATQATVVEGSLLLRAGSTLNNLGSIGYRASYTDQGATITGTPPFIVPTNIVVTAQAQTTFAPTTADVIKGDNVTWTNQSGLQHTITFTPQTGAPSDTPIGSNWASGTQIKTFNTSGTYNYHCAIHAGMNGTVVVH
jgi:plastocyanin